MFVCVVMHACVFVVVMHGFVCVCENLLWLWMCVCVCVCV